MFCGSFIHVSYVFAYLVPSPTGIPWWAYDPHFPGAYSWAERNGQLADQNSSVCWALGAVLEGIVGFKVWVPTWNSLSPTSSDLFFSSLLVFALKPFPRTYFRASLFIGWANIWAFPLFSVYPRRIMLLGSVLTKLPRAWISCTQFNSIIGLSSPASNTHSLTDSFTRKNVFFQHLGCVGSVWEAGEAELQKENSIPFKGLRI